MVPHDHLQDTVVSHDHLEDTVVSHDHLQETVVSHDHLQDTDTVVSHTNVRMLVPIYYAAELIRLSITSFTFITIRNIRH